MQVVHDSFSCTASIQMKSAYAELQEGEKRLKDLEAWVYNVHNASCQWIVLEAMLLNTPRFISQPSSCIASVQMKIVTQEVEEKASVQMKTAARELEKREKRLKELEAWVYNVHCFRTDEDCSSRVTCAQLARTIFTKMKTAAQELERGEKKLKDLEVHMQSW